MPRINLFYIIYVTSIIFLFLFSFTQIDLGLVFSHSKLLFAIERDFQLIGYFQRPVSTVLYIIIVGLLFICFFKLLILVNTHKITRKQILILLFITAGILLFSYNAFSYDLFNYIFDAKIFTFYHQNPYFHKALDYPHDSMLGFMHWTHRTYPYGPLWLVISIVLSIIGFSKFATTFFLFKLLAAISYIGSVLIIGKIMKMINPKQELFSMVLFAFNPLVIIESLVSAHNDITMLFLALIGIYLFVRNQKLSGFLLIFISIGIKFITGMILIPFILLSFYEKMNRKISNENFFKVIFLFMLIGFIYMLGKVELQPWYFLWLLPCLSLLRKNIFVIAIVSGFSLGMLLEYAPFLFQGNWNGSVITIKVYVTTLTPVLFLVSAFLLRKKYKLS